MKIYMGPDSFPEAQGLSKKQKDRLYWSSFLVIMQRASFWIAGMSFLIVTVATWWLFQLFVREYDLRRVGFALIVGLYTGVWYQYVLHMLRPVYAQKRAILYPEPDQDTNSYHVPHIE